MKSQQVSPYTVTPFRGSLNPAFKIEEAAAARRHPQSLEWLDTPLYIPNDTAIASDVPAWWLFKKKSALYYNGMGRGNLAKMLMQISVVAIQNRDQADSIFNQFSDVIAWLNQITPPSYPLEIDGDRSNRGQLIFEMRCSQCHGTYSTDPSQEIYPNLLIALSEVGTDPVYATELYESPYLAQWINQGWYNEEPHSMSAFPLLGYIAPPLDGIWSTAPYFHNGSVPTLKDVLRPSTRPTRWKRNLSSSEYDLTNIGWPYTEVESLDFLEEADRINVYDTTLRGYGNQGHLYSEDLSEEECLDLLEYLKNL